MSTVCNRSKGAGHAGLFRRWIGLILLFIAAGAANAANQLAISEDGTPSYSHPIGLPPGIAGMAPNIALLYRGGAVNGPVGHGWTIQGISMITRCPHNKIVDGSTRNIGYDGNDKLCLDGQRLIQTDANGSVINGAVTNPGPGAPFQQNDSLGGDSMVREYRTDTDMYARIRAYGAAGANAANGPAYFRVWTKGGQVFEYGVASNTSANAQITAQGKAVVAAWPVSRISDSVGNYIDFQYEQREHNWGSVRDGSSTGREWNLVEIRYTGNGAQLPRNKVLFTYADRPSTENAAQDRSEAYHNGSKNISIRLLKEVQTYVNWPASEVNQPHNAVKVKSVLLAYENGPVTQRSRLKKITECAAATRCLPATVFNYASGGDARYEHNTTFKAGPLATAVLHSDSGKVGVITGNFFGSGRLDILRWSDEPAQNALYRNDGDGSFVNVGAFNITDQHLFKSDACYSSTAADFNGDGLTDILRGMQPESSTKQSCGAQRHILYVAKGNGTFDAKDVTGIDFTKTTSRALRRYNCLRPASNGYNPNCLEPGDTYVGTERKAGSAYYILDANNDGVLDIVTTIIPGFGLTMNPPGDDVQCKEMVCTRLFLGQPGGGFSEITASNLRHRSVYADPIQGAFIPSALHRSYIADVSGDGVSDLVVDTGVWRSRADGNFDLIAPASATTACQNPMDINGDGRADCLYPNAIPSLRLADGSGALKDVANFKISPAGQELFGFAPNFAQNIGVQLSDFDGDGRTDILRWKDDPSQNAVFLSNGEGSFRKADTFNVTSPNDQLQHSNGSSFFLLGDFTGRGNTEIMRLKAAPSADSDATRNLLYVKVDSTPPDQLASVTSGAGLTTTLSWAPLTSPAFYTSDRGTAHAAAFPVVDLTMPNYVVTSTTADSGVGDTKVVNEYRYRGLKAAYDGRGWLGFREISHRKPAADGSLLRVVTRYLQDGLYTRMARSSETWLGGDVNTWQGGKMLSRSTYVYCDKTAVSDAEAAATSEAPCASAARVRRPYLWKSTEEGWDLKGHALPTVATTNTFNDGGDPTAVVVSTSGTDPVLNVAQSFTKATSNQYYPDDTTGDAWIRGRLKKATVQSSIPNSLDSMPTSAGTAPHATAIEGVAATLGVSVSPAALTVNASEAGPASGAVSASASGGTAPYTYAWIRTVGSRTSISDSSAASPTISASLNAGDNFTDTWSVTAKDAAGATATGTVTAHFTASAAPALAASINPSPLTVNAGGPGPAGGAVNASATGGTAPYSYSWARTAGNRTSISDGTAANPTISATLNEGEDFTDTWALTVTDGAGRTVSASVNARFTTPAGPPALALTGCTSTTPTTTPTAATTSCTVSNTGQSALGSISYAIFNGATVSGPTGACAANAGCGTVTVTTPTEPGVYSGNLTATPDTGTSASVSIALEVKPAPVATTTIGADPASVSIGPVQRGVVRDVNVTIINQGSVAATGMSYRSSFRSGRRTGNLSVGANSCTATLDAGASCTITISLDADCVGGTGYWAVLIAGDNFPSTEISVEGKVSTSGTCR